jgi:TonB family protein
MAHADILDQQERLAGSFWISVAMHLCILGLAIYAAAARGPHVLWGSKTGGGMGSVAVNTVSQIPLPQRTGPENPVANPTESQVPTPPKPKTEPKTVPKAKVPDADAIPLKTKNATKKAQKTQDQAPPTNKFREQQKDAPNQLYSAGGQALSSPMYGATKSGSGNLGMGTSTPFGEQLGWYANQLQDKVAQHWRTDDISPQIRTAPQVIITFTIRRDGSLVGLPQIKQSSGLQQLDRSAQRAVVESNPFPPIPPQFLKNQADIELTFELRR